MVAKKTLSVESGANASPPGTSNAAPSRIRKFAGLLGSYILGLLSGSTLLSPLLTDLGTDLRDWVRPRDFDVTYEVFGQKTVDGPIEVMVRNDGRGPFEVGDVSLCGPVLLGDIKWVSNSGTVVYSRTDGREPGMTVQWVEGRETIGCEEGIRLDLVGDIRTVGPGEHQVIKFAPLDGVTVFGLLGRGGELVRSLCAFFMYPYSFNGEIDGTRRVVCEARGPIEER